MPYMLFTSRDRSIDGATRAPPARPGEGIGGALLSHAIRTADRAGRVVAARLLVVDAIDDRAASFYRHYGLTPLTRSHSRERLAAVISHLL